MLKSTGPTKVIRFNNKTNEHATEAGWTFHVNRLTKQHKGKPVLIGTVVDVCWQNIMGMAAICYVDVIEEPITVSED